MPAAELYDELEGGLAKCPFATKGIFLRSKQSGFHNVRLMHQIDNLSKHVESIEARNQTLEQQIKVPLNLQSAERMKELENELDSVKAWLNVCDQEREKTANYLAAIEGEKQKFIDELQQKLYDLKQNENRILDELEKVKNDFASADASKEILEKEKADLEIKLLQADTARVHAEGELAGREDSIRILEGRLKSAEEFKDWILSTGLGQLYKKIKACAEFVCQALEVNKAISILGYQQGLEVGYRSCLKQIPMEEVEGYDTAAAERVKIASKNFQNSKSTLLAQIAAAKDSPIPDLKLLFTTENQL